MRWSGHDNFPVKSAMTDGASLVRDPLALWGAREHALACALYTKMELIDPTPEAPAWEEMDWFEKMFYLRCIEAVLDVNAKFQCSATTT